VVNHLRKRFDNLEDAEEEYGLSAESYLDVSELPDSDQELENVHPDTLEKLDCLSGKQFLYLGRGVEISILPLAARVFISSTILFYIFCCTGP
jgi:hypothetical protein